MSQQSEPPVPSVATLQPDGRAATVEGNPNRTGLSSAETLSVAEETLHVSKRKVVTGTVRVSTRTETTETMADVTLDRTLAEVTRVPVGRLVDVPPAVRTEGDTMIVPVFEERYVMVKQLYLTEELHIRQRVQPVVSHVPVQLRRQIAVIERLDAAGHVVPDDDHST